MSITLMSDGEGGGASFACEEFINVIESFVRPWILNEPLLSLGLGESVPHGRKALAPHVYKAAWDLKVALPYSGRMRLVLCVRLLVHMSAFVIAGRSSKVTTHRIVLCIAMYVAHICVINSIPGMPQ